MSEVLPIWKKVWREGVVPCVSREGLEALRSALEQDDHRLIQCGTTTPPPLQCVQDWPCEAACALGYVGWQGDGLETVGEVEQFFARVCYEADKRMGSPAAIRFFLNPYDEWPREEMRRLMLEELDHNLQTLAGMERGG